MNGLVHFGDVVLFVFVLFILFRSGKLLEIAQRLERLDSELRGEWRSFRSALFKINNDGFAAENETRDVLPDELARRSRTEARVLLAFLMGKLLYFLSSPILPSSAVLNAARFPALPILVDIWFCAAAFGLLNLVRAVKARRS